jgi:hypothetical protein
MGQSPREVLIGMSVLDQWQEYGIRFGNVVCLTARVRQAGKRISGQVGDGDSGRHIQTDRAIPNAGVDGDRVDTTRATDASHRSA